MNIETYLEGLKKEIKGIKKANQDGQRDDNRG